MAAWYREYNNAYIIRLGLCDRMTHDVIDNVLLPYVKGTWVVALPPGQGHKFYPGCMLYYSGNTITLCSLTDMTVLRQYVAAHEVTCVALDVALGDEQELYYGSGFNVYRTKDWLTAEIVHTNYLPVVNICIYDCKLYVTIRAATPTFRRYQMYASGINNPTWQRRLCSKYINIHVSNGKLAAQDINDIISYDDDDKMVYVMTMFPEHATRKCVVYGDGLYVTSYNGLWLHDMVNKTSTALLSLPQCRDTDDVHVSEEGMIYYITGGRLWRVAK